MLLRRDDKTKDKVGGAGQDMLNFQPREEVQVKSIKARRDPSWSSRFLHRRNGHVTCSPDILHLLFHIVTDHTSIFTVPAAVNPCVRPHTLPQGVLRASAFYVVQMDGSVAFTKISHCPGFCCTTAIRERVANLQ